MDRKNSDKKKTSSNALLVLKSSQNQFHLILICIDRPIYEPNSIISYKALMYALIPIKLAIKNVFLLKPS